jgi:transcriptional regulator with XRE-family HTH domain
MALPNRLRELREARHLSQKELSKATGIGQADLSHYEADGTKIGRVRLLILAQFLGVDVRELLKAKDLGLPRDCRECRHLKAVGVYAQAGWGCDVLKTVREDCSVFAEEHPAQICATSHKTL